jgi:hypothetical protein
MNELLFVKVRYIFLSIFKPHETKILLDKLFQMNLLIVVRAHVHV